MAPSPSAGRRSKLRRRLTFGVASVALLLAGGLGAWWKVALNQANDSRIKQTGNDSNWVTHVAQCQRTPLSNVKSTSRIVPQVPELAEVNQALSKVLDAPRWRLATRTHDMRGARDYPIQTTIVSHSGTDYLIERSDGPSLLLSPDSALVHQPGSAFWVPSCPAWPFLLASDRVTCINRTSSGLDVVFEWKELREAPCDQPGIAPSGNLDDRAVVRSGTLISLQRILTYPDSRTEILTTPEVPIDVEGPWFFQQVPTWFEQWSDS